MAPSANLRSNRGARIKFQFFFSLLALAALPVRAQDFGKNRLLENDYPYKVWQTEHFEIHYYEENPLLLQETAKFLESAYRDVTEMLGVKLPIIDGKSKPKPAEKFPFFLFTNHNEFEQTRVVDIGEGTGGVTEAFKNRLLIFNNGSLAWLKHVIYHEFGHEVEFAILHAGFWKSARLLKSILYPLWLMEGISEYVAGNIDEATDLMYARDAATSQSARPFSIRDLHNFNHLKPNQVTRAYKQGSFLVEYVADEYGEEKVRALLISFRDRFDVNSVLIDALGLDDERFDRNFQEWLEERYGEPAKLLDEPSRYGSKLTKPEEPIPVFHYSPVLSEDGRRLFTISLREGYPAIYEHDLKRSKLRILVGREFNELDWIHLDERNLSLADDRYLYFSGKKNQKDFLYRYDLRSKSLERRALGGLSAIKNPAASPKNPNQVVLAGMENGFYDLYTVDFSKGEVLERLTADPQDDGDPVFSPDASAIIYSSEVGINADGFPNRDLFMVQRDGNIVRRLTRGLKAEKAPAAAPGGKKICFLSDQDGSWDLYEMDLATLAVFRKTRVITGLSSPSYAEGGFLFAGYRDGEVHVYQGRDDQFLSDEEGAAQLADRMSQPPKKEEDPPPPLVYQGPYRFRFGTDLFFPAFFYSTQGGLFALAYWQGSDMLGRHSVATNVTLNSGIGLFDYSVGYSFTRFRPDFRLVVKGSRYRDILTVSDLGEDLRRSDFLESLIVGYPLDRYHRVEGALTLAQRYQVFPSESVPLLNAQEWQWGAQFIRDTTTAPYLVVTRGSRFAVGSRIALPKAQADLEYSTHFAEWHQFVPIGRDATIAMRTSYAQSYGPDAEEFSLAGQGGVRGYPRESLLDRQSGIALNSVEARFPLFPDLNYHMWYMFPDFYFKNIYLGLFSDQGARWKGSSRDLWEPENPKDRETLHALGISLKLNTFILETFPFFFSFEWAKGTKASGSVFYGSVFQYFKFQ